MWGQPIIPVLYGQGELQNPNVYIAELGGAAPSFQRANAWVVKSLHRVESILLKCFKAIQ